MATVCSDHLQVAGTHPYLWSSIVPNRLVFHNFVSFFTYLIFPMVTACLLVCPNYSVSTLHQRLYIQVSCVLLKVNGETVHSPSKKGKMYEKWIKNTDMPIVTTGPITETSCTSICLKDWKYNYQMYFFQSYCNRLEQIFYQTNIQQQYKEENYQRS